MKKNCQADLCRREVTFTVGDYMYLKLQLYQYVVLRKLSLCLSSLVYFEFGMHRRSSLLVGFTPCEMKVIQPKRGGELGF